MPQVTINYWAVLAAAAAAMAVGFLWYGLVFNKLWMRLSGMGPAQLEAAKAKGVNKLYLMDFVGMIVMSYVLAHSLVFASTYLQVEGVASGLMSGFWNWFGFIAPVTLGGVLWEGKPWGLWLLNNGYYLVALSLMGTILVLWV